MRLSTDCTVEPPDSTENGAAPMREELVWLIPAKRSIATEAWGPLHLAPAGSEIVSVGRHNFLPIAAVAWITDNEIVVALEGPLAESGRSTLVRVWTLENFYCRAALFESRGELAVAVQTLGTWDGLPVAGLCLVSVIEPGEEC